MGEAIVAQKSPYAAEVTAGRKYFWCACGRSANQPFCDGSHKVTSLTPVLYEPAEAGTVWFCGCKSTKSRPLCDGTHQTL